MIAAGQLWGGAAGTAPGTAGEANREASHGE